MSDDSFIPEPAVSKSSALAGSAFGVAILWLNWLLFPNGMMIWMGPVAVVYFVAASFWEYSKEKQRMIENAE